MPLLQLGAAGWARPPACRLIPTAPRSPVARHWHALAMPYVTRKARGRVSTPSSSARCKREPCFTGGCRRCLIIALTDP